MRSRAHRFSTQQGGFTLIEVLVAMTVLLIGVLGAATLLNTANAATSRSLAREGSTNLAREVLERARQVPYQTLSGSQASSQIQAKFTDETTVAGSGNWTITRRGVTYTVTTTACRIDDPSDGIGAHDVTFCDYVAGQGGTGSAVVGSSLKVNLELGGLPLNIGVDGSLVNAVCSLLGHSAALDTLLTATASLISQGADIQVCSGGSNRPAIDIDPDDLTRVTTAVSYVHRGSAQSTTQTTIVPNPGKSS